MASAPNSVALIKLSKTTTSVQPLADLVLSGRNQSSAEERSPIRRRDDVDPSLGHLMGADDHHRSLSTIVPKGAECYSTCSYILLGGKERLEEGKLGVHQISVGLPDLERGQMSISDIIDVLNRFDTPIEVLTIMFRTPADDMYIFSPKEVARYGLNHTAAVTEAATEPEPPVENVDRMKAEPDVVPDPQQQGGDASRASY